MLQIACRLRQAVLSAGKFFAAKLGNLRKAGCNAQEPAKKRTLFNIVQHAPNNHWATLFFGFRLQTVLKTLFVLAKRTKLCTFPLLIIGDGICVPLFCIALAFASVFSLSTRSPIEPWQFADWMLLQARWSLLTYGGATLDDQIVLHRMRNKMCLE